MAETGGTPVKVGQGATDFEPNSAESRSILAELGCILHPTSVHIGQNMDEIRFRPNVAFVGRPRINLNNFGPNLAHAGPNLADSATFGRNTADVGQIWPGIDPLWPDFGRIWAFDKFGQFGPPPAAKGTYHRVLMSNVACRSFNSPRPDKGFDPGHESSFWL